MTMAKPFPMRGRMSRSKLGGQAIPGMLIKAPVEDCISKAKMFKIVLEECNEAHPWVLLNEYARPLLDYISRGRKISLQVGKVYPVAYIIPQGYNAPASVIVHDEDTDRWIAFELQQVAFYAGEEEAKEAEANRWYVCEYKRRGLDI